MDLSSLNNKQQEAVTAPMGPVLVLAGPGSGKTKTLTHRIAYIIEKRLIPPSNIMALTFTNKASKEMRSRVSALLARLKDASEQLAMGTFHSVCARLLRREIFKLGYGPDFVIFDTDDQQKILKEIGEELKLPKHLPPSLFGALISRAKNHLQTPDELNLDVDPRMQEKVFEVYTRYQDALHRQNALDFDDLLMLSVKLFEADEGVLKKYQQMFKYVLVDEYQDTNTAQYRLLILLAQHHNLFVVGDDAQSIYGFRGSDITNILNFEKDFPESLVIALEQNYRSTKNILSVAQKVIELNPEQKPKTLWTENLDGEKITLVQAVDERGEAEFVAKTIVKFASGNKDEPAPPAGRPEELRPSTSILDRFLLARKKYGANIAGFIRQLPQLPKQHEPLKEYCVLYRTHAQSRSIEEALIQSGIPYQIIGGYKFYDRKEIKDMLAYLRLTLNFRDLVSLKRVINEPPRGIGEKSYQVIRDFILDYCSSPPLRGGGRGGSQEDSDQSTDSPPPNLPHPQNQSESRYGAQQGGEKDMRGFRQSFTEVNLPPKQWQSAQDFFEMIEEFQGVPKATTLPELMKMIIRRARLEQSIRDGSDSGESRWENLQELLVVAEKFSPIGGSLPAGQAGAFGGKILGNWREALSEFLEEVALLSEIDQKQDEKDAVTLMTLHSAKGLEFDTVFFVGLEEGILPHSRSLIDPKELSEEVRLAYVGLTRARKNLFLLFARSRMAFGSRQIQSPSRILKAMPKDRLTFLGGAEHLFAQQEGELEYVEELEN